MRLSRVSERLADTKIHILHRPSEEWLESGASGYLQVYDRFVSDRTFGQRKRILIIPAKYPMPEQGSVISLNSGTSAWLIESIQEDVQSGSSYQKVCVIITAPYRVQVIDHKTVQRPSGVGGHSEEDLLDEVYGVFDRYGVKESGDYENVDYSRMEFVLPQDTKISGDCFLRVGDVDYNIQEAVPQLGVLRIRAQRRGTYERK